VTDRRLDTPVQLDRAAELGRFEMGSTVILLLPPGSVEWTVRAGETVRLGQAIGRLSAASARPATTA
jgi:phosphatidylserine decarboxylase